MSAENVKPIMELHGIGGQLQLYGNKVVIKRKGVYAKLSHGFSGDKEIPIRNITSMQLKLGGNMLNGFIQFSLPGGNERRGGTVDATQDENTIMFKKSENKIAKAIKDRIEQIQSDMNRPQSVSAMPSGADEIRKLKGLLDDGIITQEEFEKKKTELLMKI